jgi:hypothetical protein
MTAQHQDQRRLDCAQHLAHSRSGVILRQVDAVAISPASTAAGEPRHDAEDILGRLVGEIGIDDLEQASPPSWGARISDVHQHQITLLSVGQRHLHDRLRLQRGAGVKQDENRWMPVADVGDVLETMDQGHDGGQPTAPLHRVGQASHGQAHERHGAAEQGREWLWRRDW